MERDGRHRKKVRAEPIVELNGHSADRRWAVAVVPAEGAPPVAEALIPLEGGNEQRICPAVCVVRWSPGGERVYIQPVQNWNNGEAVMFTLAAHESFPAFPAGGIGSVAEGLAVTGASRNHAAICAQKGRSRDRRRIPSLTREPSRTGICSGLRSGERPWIRASIRHFVPLLGVAV